MNSVMENTGRIKIDMPVGTPLEDIIRLAVEMTMMACEFNRHRAARKLDITMARVDRILKKFGRLAVSQERTGAGADASDPLPPGGQKV